ncbi:alpha/beta hydrolase [Angustibacter aerolatus]|uniref:Alpha/beta hydrolase n=1 Tax=Angustibacter aerolatus TaxID=1162965 RepID=A0ABQ6JIN1_9ACTN|nr:alpha/beta fold hydrolase [Angustibacter aerolatus]GMA87095.1 alpha/beta hydrolase [Angustibacter aerolatus]
MRRVTTGSTSSLPDGRVLHAYDAAPGGDDRLPVFWQHGTPNLGAPPVPLFAAADRLGLRWVSYDRPGYGGSTRRPGRDLASAAGDTLAVADALGLGRFAVVGHSGGGSHALAVGALLPDRVVAVVSMAGLAPPDAGGSTRSRGWRRPGWPRCGRPPRGARSRRPTSLAHGDAYDPEFTPGDLALFDGPWGWFGSVVGPALDGGPGPLVDDDVAYVSPWGVDLADARVPALVLHGEARPGGARRARPLERRPLARRGACGCCPARGTSRW